MKDLTGMVFGRWKVLQKAPSANREARWLCECSCEKKTQRSVMGRNLLNGRSTSCGCRLKEVSSKQMTELNKSRALDLKNTKYGFLSPIRPTEQRYSKSIVWECLCDCGRTTYVSVDQLRGQHPIRSCGKCSNRSLGEKRIEELLTKNNIVFISQYKVSEINKKYDFYLSDYNRLIEFDGEQHYYQISNWDSPELQQKRDKIKNEYALSHNIPLVRIPYWERDKITLDMLLGDKYLVIK